jgi:hypothetical protein
MLRPYNSLRYDAVCLLLVCRLLKDAVNNTLLDCEYWNIKSEKMWSRPTLTNNPITLLERLLRKFVRNTFRIGQGSKYRSELRWQLGIGTKLWCWKLLNVNTYIKRLVVTSNMRRTCAQLMFNTEVQKTINLLSGKCLLSFCLYFLKIMNESPTLSHCLHSQ